MDNDRRDVVPRTRSFHRAEAAKYLGLSLSGLAHMAVRGVGPRFSIEDRRAVYLRSDLDAWAAAQAYEAAAVRDLNVLRSLLSSNYCDRRNRERAYRV
jgi:hypothetical protein